LRVTSRGLGDVYKRQGIQFMLKSNCQVLKIKLRSQALCTAQVIMDTAMA
jgi:hypothetical protein